MRTRSGQAGSHMQAAATAFQQEHAVGMLFNSPIEVEQARLESGRSPDLRFIESEQPSQSLRFSGLTRNANLSAFTVTG